MPRAARTSSNGTVTPAAQGRFIPVDPKRVARPRAVRVPTAAEEALDEDPTTTAMHASNPSTEVDTEVDGVEGLLPGQTGMVAGAVGRPEMLPTTIQALGPNGETITLERDESGQFRTVNTNVPPPPVSAEIDHPLLQQLRSRTSKPKGLVQRAPAYNHRLLWYMKPDGEIVPLQGDPGNRAYYEDKGYVVLRDQEEQMYLRGDRAVGRPPIRRLVIAEQRKRAQLITTIRNIAKRNPSVELVGDLSITPTEELEEHLDMLRQAQGVNFRLIEARSRTRGVDQDERDDAILEQGLETGSGHDLYRKMARSREQQRIGGLNRAPSEGAVEMSTSGQMMPE